MLDKREIGTYVAWEKMVESYTTGVTGKDVFELLTGAVIDDNTVLRYVDGGLDKTFDEDAVLLRSNRNDLADTGKGALTEVYLDTDQDEIRIVTVNTWLAQATSDYNTSSELATVKIFDKYNADTMVTGSSTQSVDAEVVPAVAELKKDDYVLVNQSIKDRTKLEVVAIRGTLSFWRTAPSPRSARPRRISPLPSAPTPRGCTRASPPAVKSTMAL